MELPVYNIDVNDNNRRCTVLHICSYTYERCRCDICGGRCSFVIECILESRNLKGK